MIIKKLSASDIGLTGQRAVNIPKEQIDFFNIKNLKNESKLPNIDYKLIFTERYSSEKHNVTLSYKPSSEQWRIIGLSNNNEFFKKNKIVKGDYFLIHINNNSEFIFETQKSSNVNQKFIDFLLVYFYLFEQKTFRELDKNIFKISNQNGSKSQKRLNSEFDITDLQKKSFRKNGFSKEYESSQGKYRNALVLLKEYYLQIEPNQEEESSNTNKSVPPFKLSDFQENCKSAGLNYSPEQITRYISSLATKPFVLLSGLSGSGKTKLAQAYAQWICESEEQYCIVPVGADWTNREPLLGYVNALDNKEYILPENGALNLIIKANTNQEKPYFLILDEMNLSHVERYFADFLSVMESKDEFKLHNGSAINVPQSIGWPANLFVVGTVNIDETTYMFSPKVLDRANVIEFRMCESDLENYFKPETKPLDMKKLWQKDSKIGLGAQFGEDFVAKSIENTSIENLEYLNTELINFFRGLESVGTEFGYRTASEIQTLYRKIDIINPNYDKEEGFTDIYSENYNFKIDVAIMQKLLPKLHGSRRKLSKPLTIMAGLCLKEESENIFNENGEININKGLIKYPLSFYKIARMYKSAIENGFASYAEA